MTDRRRFPPPWSVENHVESFVVRDAKRLTQDEARRIAANNTIVKT
jgi:hypothetical protein